MIDTNDLNVVWQPLKGSQTLAMSCPANIILYHGTRGPGKTDAQLMRFRRNVGLGYGPFWRGVIFDRKYKNLDDIKTKSLRWFNKFNDGAKFMRSTSDYKWVWPTGEELLLRSIEKPDDYWDYHGQEYAYLGWNELTNYPDPNLFYDMMSCNRSSFRPEDYPLPDGRLLPPIPLEIFATSNPFGVGHNWVKKEFINAAPAGRIVAKEHIVSSWEADKDDVTVTRTQVHIYGNWRENKYLPREYVATLHDIKDPNKAKAWRDGSWDVMSGGMFDANWDSQYHVLAPFEIPDSWRIDRSFDWGSSSPFSVGWWAQSDGSEVRLANGQMRSTVRGDLFRIGELYGSKENSSLMKHSRCSDGTVKGLRMLAKDIAVLIVAKEVEMGIHSRVKPGPADNSIYTEENGNDIGKSMARTVKIDGKKYNGVRWHRSDKASGSRTAGWEKMRVMLDNALPPKEGVREYPGLFVFNTCNFFIDLVPTLPRDKRNPDDVDTNSEDHIADETRYRVLRDGRKARTGKTIGLN